MASTITVYVYIYTHIYIYIYICIVYGIYNIYVYTYIYIERERERVDSNEFEYWPGRIDAGVPSKAFELGLHWGPNLGSLHEGAVINIKNYSRLPKVGIWA